MHPKRVLAPFGVPSGVAPGTEPGSGGISVTKSSTRQELIRTAWRARKRALRERGVLERSRAWMEWYQAMIAARKLPRTLEESWSQ